VRDAGLIGAAQRVEHYEIAAYGTARTLADQLGFDDAKDLLDQTLDEESNADKLLTKIATGGILSRASTRRRPSSSPAQAGRRRGASTTDGRLAIPIQFGMPARSPGRRALISPACFRTTLGCGCRSTRTFVPRSFDEAIHRRGARNPL
jgi:hypothetical protein